VARRKRGDLEESGRTTNIKNELEEKTPQNQSKTVVRKIDVGKTNEEGVPGEKKMGSVRKVGKDRKRTCRSLACLFIRTASVGTGGGGAAGGSKRNPQGGGA